MLQMADQSKFLNFVPFDLGKLDNTFRRTQLSLTDHFFQTPNPSLFPLKLFVFLDDEGVSERLARFAAMDLQQSAYFIISESLAPWINPLLKAGAFDVTVGRPCLAELYGKTEYFFSEPHQSKIFKSHPPFKIDLTRKEQQLFEFLISHPQGVTRQELMTLCWKNLTVHPKTLDVHLFNLRQKLETVGAAIRFNDGKWIIDFANVSIGDDWTQVSK